jgi:hypothetical protein
MAEDTAEDRYSEFRSDLKHLLNRHSMEQPSQTPDYVLADYLVDCLRAFNRAVGTRDGWGRLEPKGSPIYGEQVPGSYEVEHGG